MGGRRPVGASVLSGTVERLRRMGSLVKGNDLQRPWDNLFGNLHSCCMLPDVMVPWHVVMGKAEYGHNAGNELRRYGII